MNSKTKFFLGANSNIDFISYFKQLQEQNSSMQLLILKGGPGSGKSSLMKRLLKYALDKGHTTEIIPCASDPESLDAFIDYTQKFAIMDGTAPHTEDPSLPGARHHILYTGDLWNTALLSPNAEKIHKLSEEVSLWHRSAGAYIKSACALLKENIRCAEKCLNKEKIAQVSSEITKKIKSGKKGNIKKRLLSAVSVGDIKLFSETPYALADNIYIINDRWGAAADFILKAVFSAASLNSVETIYCPCSVMPEKCDHLIFPESRVALLTRNSFLNFSDGIKIDGESFYSEIPCLDEMEMRLKNAKKLLPYACEAVKNAKLVHDDLEAYYIDAMDFSGMDALFGNIVDKFYI